MDSPIDHVENTTPYQGSDQVSPAHRSERDKDRKFARALKEKLEEELEKKKKQPKQDSVTLGDETQTEPEPEQEEPVDTDASPTGTDVEDQQEPAERHIDLKA